MPLEPLNVSMMTGRIAIAAAALSHVLFATFIVGTAVIGAGIATANYYSRAPRWGRLAHMISFTLVLSTATISFMGVVLVFFLNIFWPHFWSTLFRIMFYPFLLEASFFLGEAIFAYAWYYGWAWSLAEGHRRRFHLSFVWLTAFFAVAAMLVIDMVGSYMLTPAPPETFWPRLLNPTLLHLHAHRWFGNLVWAGFALAALTAIASLRAKRDEDRAQYEWAGRLLFTIGFTALLVMPVIGFFYLRRIRYVEPQIFFTLMLGERSPLFALTALLYGLLVLAGLFYIFKTARSQKTRPASFDSFMPLSLWAAAIATVIFAMPYRIQHLPFVPRFTDAAINPLGKMQPHKYIAIAVLLAVGLSSLIYFLIAFRGRIFTGLRKGEPKETGRAAPFLLISLAVLSILIYLTMGWIRETARASDGYLIYGMIRLEDERPTYGPSAAPPAPSQNEAQNRE